MNETKHTPGPWVATGFEGIIVNGADGVTLALHPGTGPLETVRANARLIAAAPDLAAALAECERILYARHADGNSPGGREAMAAVNAARSALVKAGVRS